MHSCDVDTLVRQTKSQETNTMSSASNTGTLTNSNSNQNHVGSQSGQEEVPSMKGGTGQSCGSGGNGGGGGGGGANDGEELCKSEGTQVGGTLHQQQQQQTGGSASTKNSSTASRTKEYNDEMVRNQDAIWFFHTKCKKWTTTFIFITDL